MGDLLQPCANVTGQDPLWNALDRQPEFRLKIDVPNDGGWLSLVWDSSMADPVFRPILIFDRCDENGRSFESDALLAGASFGRQKAILFVPTGTRSIRFSPSNRPGPFGFRLHEAQWISPIQAFSRGFSVQPLQALHALGAWLIRRPDDFRLLLTEAIGARPMRDYAMWKEERFRQPDWTGIDQLRVLPTPRLRICSTPLAEQPAPLSNLSRSLPIEWRSGVADGDGPESLARLTDSLGEADLCLFLPAGSAICPESLPALLTAAVENPDAVLFYGDEEIDAPGGSIIGHFRAGFDPLVTFDDLRDGAAFAVRVGVLRQWAAGHLAPVAPQGVALHRPLARRAAHVSPPISGGFFHWLASGWPLHAPPAKLEPPDVTIIIPTRDRLDLLRACIESLEATVPSGVEIAIIDNESREPATHEYLRAFAGRPNRKVLSVPGPFNFSKLCNLGARASTGRVLLFLNNDTTALSPDWVTTLCDYAVRPDCGAVGARLLYPSGHVQHAGIAIGVGGYAGHLDLHASRDCEGQFGRARRDHSLLAVTGACLAVERRKFEAVGGFDEENLPVDLNDVDLCLRLSERTWRTIFAARCELIHHESASRGRQPGNARYHKEKTYFAKRWRHFRRADPYFHPALSLLLTRGSLG